MPYDSNATGNGEYFLMESLDTPQSQRTESSYLIDLRRQPRFDTQFPAEAVAESGVPVYAFITNISLSGMRLEGSQKMLNTLFPETGHLLEHTPTIMQVYFTLPDESAELASVKVECRSVYMRCEREGTYQVGMEIIVFEEGKAAFKSYLRQREATG